MEKKNMYREYFPGYCGHIPYKYEVIGKTVGATNYHIKSLLTKEPDYSQTYIPSINKDYTYYKKDYFNSDFAKGYELEEDKIFGMRSKEARTWINGNKHQLYPEHIPGYTGHLTGIEPAGKKGCPIFGSSYAKSTAISIKGNYNKDIDVPPEDRYLSVQKKNFVVPQMRSKEDMGTLSRENDLIEEAKNAKEYFDKLKVRRPGQEREKINFDLSEGFKNAINRKRSAPKLPYIVGYKGFRPGVVSNNYYGKNFREISLVTSNPD